MNKTVFRMLSGTALCIGMLAQQAWAQPTLKHIEDFDPGHKMIYVSLEGQPEPGKEGANITWDFSALRVGKDSVSIDILSLPGDMKAQFPKANSIERRSDGTTIVVNKQPGFSELQGLLVQGNAFTYSMPYRFMARPFGYKSQITSQPERSYTISTTFKGKGNTLTIADGWGTLILPGGEKRKALRVRFEQDYTDVSAQGSMKMHIITYAWFDEAHKGAIFKINTTKIESPYYNKNEVDGEMLVSESDAEY